MTYTSHNMLYSFTQQYKYKVCIEYTYNDFMYIPCIFLSVGITGCGVYNDNKKLNELHVVGIGVLRGIVIKNDLKCKFYV